MHRATYDYLYGLALDEQRGQDVEDYMAPHVAFRTLLQGRSLYGEVTASETLAPFVPGTVSLPSDISGAVDVGILGGSVCQVFLDRNGERMRRSAEETAEDEDLKQLRVHSDPLLVGYRRRYSDFIKDMDSRSMLDWTLDPIEHVGIFFRVQKGKEDATAYP